MRKKNQNQVINDFGNEWAKFDNVLISNTELKKFLDSYFYIFQKNSLTKKLLV